MKEHDTLKQENKNLHDEIRDLKLQLKHITASYQALDQGYTAVVREAQILRTKTILLEQENKELSTSKIESLPYTEKKDDKLSAIA
jgi:hypothetical protein